MSTRKAKQIPFPEAVAKIEAEAAGDQSKTDVVALLRSINEQGVFDDASFDKVWALLQATAGPVGDAKG